MNHNQIEKVSVALLEVLDGVYDKWWEVKENTGLPRIDCEKILHARDLAMFYFGKELLGDYWSSPFKNCEPSQFSNVRENQKILNEVAKAFDKEKGEYNEADRRFLLATMMDRGMVVPSMVYWHYSRNSDGKLICEIDGCELAHCKKCGEHYNYGEEERIGECPNCTVLRASAEAETVTKAFGGDSEKAAKHMGW